MPRPILHFDQSTFFTINMADVIEYTKSKWTTEEPSLIAKQIAEGHRLPTEAFGFSNDVTYRAQVVQEGAIDGILEFLQKTDKSFKEVIKGGDLPCPSIWLNVLNNFCQDGYLQPQNLARDVKYKIVVRLEPLFQAMSDFGRRQLFGSKDYWIKCLMFFTNMLSGLLTSEYKRVGDFMLKQPALKTFLVRVLFLEIGEPQVRSDILDFEKRDNRIPKPDIIGMSQTFAAFAIKSLSSNREATILEEFASTSIRPEHDITLAKGIITLLQSSKRRDWFKGGFASTLNIFLQLYDRCGRLSDRFGVECVPAKMVTICNNYLIHHAILPRDRYFLENVMTSIIVLAATMMTPALKQRQAPIDYNVGKAVESGLIEYCLDCCDTNDNRIQKPLEGLLRGPVLSCASLEDTKKAIKAKEETIRARVERVKERTPFLFQQVETIENILQLALPNPRKEANCCEFCFEKTSKGTTIKCPFCKSVIYCSKDCQRLNWMLHQSNCEGLRKSPPAKSQAELMIDGKRIFGQQITKILLQASLKGTSILDCFIVVDMCEATPLLKTYTPEQFAQKYIQDDAAIAESKRILERNKSNGAATVSFAGFTPDGLNANLMTFPPRTAPPVMGVEDSKKWIVAQRVATQQFFALHPGVQEKMKAMPQVYQTTLLKSMKP